MLNEQLTDELLSVINTSHNYDFFAFVRKCYDIIYVKGSKLTKKQVETLRKLYKGYLDGAFENDVVLVKFDKAYKVYDFETKLPRGVKYKFALAWKNNNKILFDFDSVDWMEEVYL